MFDGLSIKENTADDAKKAKQTNRCKPYLNGCWVTSLIISRGIPVL
jgi:hypothetical protein